VWAVNTVEMQPFTFTQFYTFLHNYTGSLTQFHHIFFPTVPLQKLYISTAVTVSLK
jgi:hypothetical protein